MLVVVTYLYSLTFYDYSNFVSCWHTSRALIITFDLLLPFPSYSPKSFVYPFQKVVASFWDKAKVHLTLAGSFFSSICMLVFGNTQIKIPVREIGLNTTIFYHLYPTFPKGIILLQQLLGRSRQRENSFVVLLFNSVSLRQNSLDQFFFFGKLSFSWLVVLASCCKTHFLKGKEQMVTLFCLFTTIACMKDVSSDGKICISCQMNQC